MDYEVFFMTEISDDLRFLFNNYLNQNIQISIMLYNIYETETFSKLFESLEKEEKEWIDKIKLQIKENPKVGKPLRFEWFREKKFGNKRLYYLIYKKIDKILLVAFGSKKKQQKIIDHILANKERYKRIIEST